MPTDGRSAARSRPGATRDGRVAVLSGLKEGEQVVSAGHNKLRNGQAVMIDEQAGTRAAGSRGPAA